MKNAIAGAMITCLVLPCLAGDTVDRPGRDGLTPEEAQIVLDIRLFTTLLVEFERQHDAYPETDDDIVTLKSIAELRSPPYRGRYQSKDPWGKDVVYWSDGSDYAVLSSGPDGRWDSNYYVIDPSEWAYEPGDDVIFGEGVLLKGPRDQRERQERTMADLRSIATAIEEFSIDNNYYPDTLGAVDFIDALSPHVVPTYIRRLPRTDGWGNPFLGWSSPGHYVIYSAGSDGVPDASYGYGQPFPAEWGGKTSTYSSDVVFSDGTFVQWPEGKQD